jgi:hypothetical protein
MIKEHNASFLSPEAPTKNKLGWDMVVHACNLSYLGGSLP